MFVGSARIPFPQTATKPVPKDESEFPLAVTVEMSRTFVLGVMLIVLVPADAGGAATIPVEKATSANSVADTERRSPFLMATLPPECQNLSVQDERTP